MTTAYDFLLNTVLAKFYLELGDFESVKDKPQIISLQNTGLFSTITFYSIRTRTRAHTHKYTSFNSVNLNQVRSTTVCKGLKTAQLLFVPHTSPQQCVFSTSCALHRQTSVFLHIQYLSEPDSTESAAERLEQTKDTVHWFCTRRAAEFPWDPHPHTRTHTRCSSRAKKQTVESQKDKRGKDTSYSDRLSGRDMITQIFQAQGRFKKCLFEEYNNASWNSTHFCFHVLELQTLHGYQLFLASQNCTT